jgi:hypothetical protein
MQKLILNVIMLLKYFKALQQNFISTFKTSNLTNKILILIYKFDFLNLFSTFYLEKKQPKKLKYQVKEQAALEGLYF